MVMLATEGRWIPGQAMPRDRRNKAFGRYVTELIAGRTDRLVDRLTGISHSYIGNIRGGIVPSYGKIRQLADGLELSLGQRAKLISLAFPEEDDAEQDRADRPAAEVTYEPDLEDSDARLFTGLRELPLADRQLVMELVERLARRDREGRG